MPPTSPPSQLDSPELAGDRAASVSIPAVDTEGIDEESGLMAKVVENYHPQEEGRIPLFVSLCVALT